MSISASRFAIAAAALALLAGCETYLPGPASARLVGTRWVAQTIDTAPAFGPRPISLFFDPAGKIDGNAGCNSYFGSYVLDGRRFDLDDVGSTKMACQPDLMRQEAVYLSVLSIADRYRWEPDGRLTIGAPNGQSIVFVPETYQPYPPR